MDSVTQRLMMGAAGGAGAAKIYVEDVFSTWLYTGNGSTQTITNGIDLSGKGGLVWGKSRSSATNNVVFDTIRGLPGLVSNGSFGQSGDSSQDLSGYTSSGFSLRNYSGDLNTNGQTYASWTFRKAEKFFDVVSYTGSGANRTIAHSLGSVPGTIIVKRTDTTGDWQVYHRSLANTEYMVLNSTAAKATGTTRWNSTTPTSTEFSLGTDATVNASGGTYVAYLFAHDAGGFGDSGNESVVSCGSFTTDGSGNATVTLGWEPQWVLMKKHNAAGQSWILLDSMRGTPLSGHSAYLSPNASGPEYADFGLLVKPNATGFTSTIAGESSSSYIYIAIRRGPMKTPTDATKVFDADAQAGGSFVTTSFPVDLSFLKRRANVETTYAISRLLGGTQYLQTTETTAEQNAGASPVVRFDSNSGIEDDLFGTGSSLAYYNFRRAPGFFDVVAYTGTGAVRTVNHNLGVAPELMIVKARSLSNSWIIYPNNSLQYLLFTSDAVTASGIFWNSSAPTASTFSLGSHPSVNSSSNTYIAYLFASCPGVSKVGSYTGTGTTLQVNCGFTNGARFVLIKRTDSTGDWYVWDTARGIIAANDPYLLLNSTAAEVTNTDYIDPLNSGFEISSTAPAAINANGGTYIYLAIA